MSGDSTSTFLPPAAASAIRTASVRSQSRKVTRSAGSASCGWWVITKTGPVKAPP
jgi:hypothetical protein